MAEREEQAKPFAQSHRLRSDDEGPEKEIHRRHFVNDTTNKSDVFFHRRSNCIKYCGCASAIIVIAAVAMIILAFTVFHVRPPTVKLNSVTVQSNLTTLIAELSVRNPNAASFRFESSTTEIFHDENSIGEGSILPGVVGARRTIRTNVTVVLESTALAVDLVSGSSTMKSLTKIEGRVKIGNVVNKRVVVELKCNIMYNNVRGIQIQSCVSDVDM